MYLCRMSNDFRLNSTRILHFLVQNYRLNENRCYPIFDFPTLYDITEYIPQNENFFLLIFLITN